MGISNSITQKENYTPKRKKISRQETPNSVWLFGFLWQDLCSRILYRTTCARSLSGSWRASSARSLSQDGSSRPLVQELCVCWSLFQDLSVRFSAWSCRAACARSLYSDFLCQISSLSVRISAAGSCRTTCARALYENLLCKMSSSPDLCSRTPYYIGPLVEDPLPDCKSETLPAFRTMDTCDLRRGLHLEIDKSSFTSIPRHRAISADSFFFPCGNQKNATLPASRAMDTHDLGRRARLEIEKNQLYQHSARSTRATPPEGCIRESESATLSAFRAINTHDLRRGPLCEITKKQVHQRSAHSTTRRARSLQNFPMSKPRFRSVRPPRNHDSNSYKMLRWPRKSILKFKFQNCNLSQERALQAPNIAPMLRWSCKTQSFAWRTPDKVLANVRKTLHLPRFSQSARPLVPAT